MAARTPVLDKTDLFGTLPPELLEQLRGRTALARYRRGDTIFEKGDPATHLYVVFSGPDRHRRQGVRRPRVGAHRARPGRAVRRDVDVRRRRALGERPGAHDRPPDRGRVRRRARRARSAGPRCCGPSCASSPAACAPPTKRSPTRCSSTSPAAPPSGCSSSPTARTTSACRSPKRSWPAWSARHASA